MGIKEYNGEELEDIKELPAYQKYFEYLNCKSCNQITKHNRNNKDFIMSCEYCKNENYIDESRDHRLLKESIEKKVFRFLKKHFYNILLVEYNPNDQSDIEYNEYLEKRIRIYFKDYFNKNKTTYKIITNKSYERNIKSQLRNLKKGSPKLYFHLNITDCKGYRSFPIYQNIYRIIEFRKRYFNEILKKTEFCFKKISITKNGIRLYFEEEIGIYISNYIDNDLIKSIKPFLNDTNLSSFLIPFWDKLHYSEYPFEEYY